MRRFLRGVLRFSEHKPAGVPEHITGAEEIANLKAQSSPGSFAFTPSMDAQERSRDLDLGHDIRLAHYLRVEDLAIKSHRSIHVFCPDDIFQFFDLHAASVVKLIRFGNSALSPRCWAGMSLPIRGSDRKWQINTLLTQHLNILPFSRLLSSIGLLAFLITAGDAQNFYPPEPAASTAINFDNRGFLINGQRTFILSASVEYARVPRALWRDRLLRIKRSGFNCIELYTFWNFHEIQEGKFDFTGDKDLGAFLDLAHELGLYATVRVGPYVCAEWENGGYPMWLRFKPPMCVRTNDPLFLNYVDRWYDHILPIVASRQIQRGGPVIMVQLENEDPRGWGASHGDPCFAHLLAKARALGIAVPTFFSGMNHGGDPAPKQPISSANRPNPWYSTEYWSGWYNWYGSLDPKPGGTLTHYSRAAWRFLENGGNGFNIYMFHGGTNFANWNNEETAASYDYSGAVGQAGDLRNIYYRYKRVALFATSFESILENCDDSSATYKNEAAGVTIAARTGPSGTLLFLDNPLTVPATAKLSNGNEMKLDAGDVVGLVRDFPLTNTFKIESSAARILGLVRQGGITTLVLYGPTGDSGQVQFTVTAAQGQKITPGVSGWTSNASNPNSYGLTVAFPAKEPRVYEMAVGDKKLRVLAVNTELADHTWFVHSRDDSLIVCGPSYVGDVTAGPSGMRFTAEDALDAKASTAAWVYDSSDNTTNFAPTPFSSINSSAPALAAWQCASASPEADPSFDDLHWKSSDDPLPMGADGDNSAYAWYRTSVHADAPGQKFLQIPFIGDNAIVFVNGVRTPSTAAGPSMVPVTLQAGANSIAILASHKGRSKFGNCGPIDLIDRKGLIGPIRLSNADTPPSALPDGKFRAYWEKYPSIDTLVDPALDTSDPKWRDFGFIPASVTIRQDAAAEYYGKTSPVTAHCFQPCQVLSVRFILASPMIRRLSISTVKSSMNKPFRAPHLTYRWMPHGRKAPRIYWP